VQDSLLQRLVLKPAKISLLAEGIRSIALQEEPIGRLITKTEVAEGKTHQLKIKVEEPMVALNQPGISQVLLS
jgi:gamma-glutamyl phosphate reductase